MLSWRSMFAYRCVSCVFWLTLITIKKTIYSRLRDIQIQNIFRASTKFNICVLISLVRQSLCVPRSWLPCRLRHTVSVKTGVLVWATFWLWAWYWQSLVDTSITYYRRGLVRTINLIYNFMHKWYFHMLHFYFPKNDAVKLYDKKPIFWTLGIEKWLKKIK